MPPGTSLEESDRIGRTIERVALSTPGVSCVYRRTGSPKSGYQIEGVNKGELLIKLKPKNERDRSASRITASLKKAYSRLDGVVLLYHQPTQEKIDESFSGLPAFFGVTIYGPDTEELASLADRVEKILSEDPAVSNVVNNTKVKASEIDVRVDYARAAQLGMEPEDIFAALQASNLGIEATRIIRQNEDVAVMVKLDAGKLLDLDSLHRLPVLTADGAAVPLQGVADVRINQTPAAITRLNGQREVTLVAEVDGNIPGIVSRLRKKFASIGMPGDYSIEFSGQYKVLIKSATEVFFAVACAVFLIYLIMAMQFGSWLQPLIILVTVPLALAGAFIALFVTREGLDVSVGMGAVTLAGIAVNNGIVLVDFANRQAAAGKTAMEAMLSAASVRLRPILLTTLTTIAALLPAAMGMSGGSRIFQPFAVTVIGGLVTSVCATLIIVPTLAVMFGHPKGEK
jgi:multidrug efflux pump subunit AcrB